MRMTTIYSLIISLLILMCGPIAAFGDDGGGSLVFDVKPYMTKIRIKKKWESRIRVVPVSWGVTGNQLIITQVNENQLSPKIPHETRYGETETVELAEGEYSITCVGFNLDSNSGNVDKMLSKSAFFNLDSLSFRIEPAKVTTLEVQPEIVKHSTLILKMWLPVLHVKVIEDGVERAPQVLCKRNPGAIAWDDYSGPLKFRPSAG